MFEVNHFWGSIWHRFRRFSSVYAPSPAHLAANSQSCHGGRVEGTGQKLPSWAGGVADASADGVVGLTNQNSFVSLIT